MFFTKNYSYTSFFKFICIFLSFSLSLLSFQAFVTKAYAEENPDITEFNQNLKRLIDENFMKNVGQIHLNADQVLNVYGHYAYGDSCVYYTIENDDGRPISFNNKEEYGNDDKDFENFKLSTKKGTNTIFSEYCKGLENGIKENKDLTFWNDNMTFFAATFGVVFIFNVFAIYKFIQSTGTMNPNPQNSYPQKDITFLSTIPRSKFGDFDNANAEEYEDGSKEVEDKEILKIFDLEGEGDEGWNTSDYLMFSGLVLSAITEVVVACVMMYYEFKKIPNNFPVHVIDYIHAKKNPKLIWDYDGCAGYDNGIVITACGTDSKGNYISKTEKTSVSFLVNDWMTFDSGVKITKLYIYSNDGYTPEEADELFLKLSNFTFACSILENDDSGTSMFDQTIYKIWNSIDNTTGEPVSEPKKVQLIENFIYGLNESMKEEVPDNIYRHSESYFNSNYKKYFDSPISKTSKKNPLTRDQIERILDEVFSNIYK